MMNVSEKPKVIVVVGPTASGKSDFAVRIAKKFNGEVVSADSRQVYRGLNIGTGKVTRKEMCGVAHHMLDVVSPKRVYTVAEYVKRAKKVVEDIQKRGRTPVVVGGTGFYIRALIDGIVIPEVPQNDALRKKLDKLSAAELFIQLSKLDPAYAKQIDRHNPRRLIRAIEIARTLGKMPPLVKKPSYHSLKIGIRFDGDELSRRIAIRLHKRLKGGMMREAKHMHEKGLTWKRMEDIGLEYRYLSRYLRGKLSKQEMVAELEKAIVQYSKRQRTWFKKDDEIQWYSKEALHKAIKVIEKFLK